jgi:hypothetical protein
MPALLTRIEMGPNASRHRVYQVLCLINFSDVMRLGNRSATKFLRGFPEHLFAAANEHDSSAGAHETTGNS